MTSGELGACKIDIKEDIDETNVWKHILYAR